MNTKCLKNPLMWGALGFVGTFFAVPRLVKELRKISLNKKVVLIMGGSRGLALEISRILLKEGAILALAARNNAELDRAVEILGAQQGRLQTFVCDVTDNEQVKNTVAAVEERLGSIDILINNAGLIEVGPMEVQTTKDYDASMRTHFWGPYYAVQAVAPGMRRRHMGRIVNISSIAGLVSVPHLLPYSTSKHALVGYSQGLRSELLKDNIFVTTVCPGLMRTGSPVNAQIKGHKKIEYALFALLDALPVSSIDAANAARQIVKACQYGEANLVISIQARALHMAHSLLPNLLDDMMGMTNLLLPGVGAVGTDTALGRDSQSFVVPSFLTKLSDDAARRNNENEPD